MENTETEGVSDKKIRNILFILFGTAIVAILATVVFYTLLAENRHYTGYDIENREEKKNLLEENYVEENGRLIVYNKEGIRGIDVSGEIIWDTGLSLKAPKVEITKNYIGVADVGGKELYYLDQTKSPVTPKRIDMRGKILGFSLSEQGQVAVMMEEEGGYLIQILEPGNKENMVRAEIKTLTAEDGYGIGVALSKDGTKLVTSFLHSEGNEIKSKLTFYNFAATGEGSNADRIVGIFPYQDTVFGRLKFFTGDVLCAFGDNLVLGFSMNHEPKLLWEKEIRGRVMKVSGDERGIGMVVTEKGLAERVEDALKEGKEEEILKEGFSERKGDIFYAISPTGKMMLEKELEFSPFGMEYKRGEALFFSENSVLMLNEDGSEKFSETFGENIIGLFPSRQKTRYFLVTSKYVEMIKLNE